MRSSGFLSGRVFVVYFLCSEVRQYPTAADSTLPTKKRKFEQMQESPKKVLIEEIVDESKFFQEVVM
jgi:hypothetical protein